MVEEYRYVECDRPFVYAIVDMTTMTPIFVGTVNAV
jgi:serpin B